MAGEIKNAPGASLVGLLGAALLYLLCCTWVVRFVGRDNYQKQLDTSAGFIFSMWHETIIPLTWIMRKRGFTMLVSQNKDGEYITRVLNRLGYNTVRGSSSRGGFRSLITMAKLAREGKVLGITPDGPRGPRRVVQGGALIIAQRGNVPILPIMVAASPRKRLSSWDRFMIPLPFAKVVVAIGEPIRLDPELSPQLLSQKYQPVLDAAMRGVAREGALTLKTWTGTADAEDLIETGE